MLSKRTPAKRWSEYDYSSELLNNLVETLGNQNTSTPVSAVPVAPLKLLTQEEEPLDDEFVQTGSSIPLDIFLINGTKDGFNRVGIPRISKEKTYDVLVVKIIEFQFYALTCTRNENYQGSGV